MSGSQLDRSRRGFLRKAAYTAPLIATISVLPSIAAAGSCNNCQTGSTTTTTTTTTPSNFSTTTFSGNTPPP